MNVLITICARGGSKGVPGKNIKKLEDIPLIAYTIQQSKRLAHKFENATIALSTDDVSIKLVCSEFGLITNYIRPTRLAQDNSGKVEVIYDLLSFQEEENHTRYDFIIDLDVTSPLRTVNEIMECFNKLNEDEEAYNIFSVGKAKRNPYFNQVEYDNSSKFVQLSKKIENINRRQVAPKVFDMNASIYIYRRSFFTQEFKSVFTPKSLAYEMSGLCFDIDEQIDFEIMESLIKSKIINIER